MKPRRIQRRRAKGWRSPANTVYVGRPSPWGNPFVVGTHGTREQCVELYKVLLSGHLMISSTSEHIAEQERVLRYVDKHYRELKGRNVSCFCPIDKPCHADVLLALANGKKIRVPALTRIN